MTAADLLVPDEALEAHIYQHRHTDDPTEAGVRAIAAPVVAAELRRLARVYDRARREKRELVLPSAALRRRAAEVEGGTS